MPHVEIPQTEFKVVVLGDTNVGKTSLVLRFAEGYYREKSRSPTVGAFFLTKRMQTSSGVTAKVQIWDTAGKAQFRKMAPIYWRNSAAILLCYDMGSVQSWNVALEWLKDLRCDSNVLEKNIVLALVATKSDLYEDGNAGAGGGNSSSNTVVPMAQVEQVLQSMNQNHTTSFVPPNSSVLNSSRSSSAAVAASVLNAASPTNQQGNNNNNNNSGEGQILHVLTSARNDENVDILFQKVAEEVLYVQEQERNLWMNYGIKYKHYSTSTSNINTSIMNTTNGDDGLGDLDNLNKNNMMNGNGNGNVVETNNNSSSTLITGNHRSSIGHDGRQSQSSPPHVQSKHPTHNQYENTTLAMTNRNGTAYHENKENKYQTSSSSPPHYRNNISRSTIVHDDAYRLHHQEAKNNIVAFKRSKDISDNTDTIGSSVGSGLCYSSVCGSTSVVVDHNESSSCIIS